MDHQEQFFPESLFNDAQREEWRSEGANLNKTHEQQQWLLGEWVDAGVGGLTRKTALAEAMKITGYAKTTLWDFCRTAHKFPESRRRDLSWSHHKELAISKLTDEKRWGLRDRAAVGKWSIQELRANVKNELAKGNGKIDGEKRRNIRAVVTKATYNLLTTLAKRESLDRSTFVGNILEKFREQQKEASETQKRGTKLSRKTHRQIDAPRRLSKMKLKRVA